MKSTFLSLLTVTFLLISCQGQTNKTTEQPQTESTINLSIDAKSFVDKLATTQDAQLIDVRTPNEFAGKHLGNAVNISTNDPNFVANIEKLDKSKPTFVYCLSGGRSSNAAAKMQELGFKEVYNMQGGMMKYNALGLGNQAVSKAGMTMADYEKILATDKTVVIDFYAEWCGPCKKMAPYLDKMTTELKDKVTIVRIDVDKNEALATQMKVDALPTIMVYKDKKVAWQNVGYITEEELKKHL